MNISPVIAALVAAGGTVAQVQAVIEAFEAQANAELADKTAHRREVDAARQRRYRQSHPPVTPVTPVTPGHEPSRVTIVTPPLDKEALTTQEINPSHSPPTPALRLGVGSQPKQEKINGQKASPRRSERIATDWQLPADWRQWAIDEEGFPVGKVDRLGLQFRDYWLAKGGKDACKQDWKAVWQGWVRRELDRHPELVAIASKGADLFDGMTDIWERSPDYPLIVERYRATYGREPEAGETGVRVPLEFARRVIREAEKKAPCQPIRAG